MTRLILFTQGYTGYRLIAELNKLNISPIVYTYSMDATNKTRDRQYLREGYPYRYINERSFDPALIDLKSTDLIVCADWTKDFFHAHMPQMPVYHIHPSLLPMYRGYGAVSEQFLKGIAISGVTLYVDNCHIDAGDILFRQEIRVSLGDYPADLIGKACEISAGWLSGMLKGHIPASALQNEDNAFYVQRKRSKQGLIDFNTAAMNVYNTIRAYSTPFFGSYFINKGRKVTVWRAECEKWTGEQGKAGTVIAQSPAGIEIACGEGSIILTKAEIDGLMYERDMIIL